MVFMRGLRLVFPEVEIASGKFIREFTDIVEHAGLEEIGSILG